MTSPDNMLPRNATARNISDITDHGPLTPSGTIWPQRQQTDFDRYEDRTTATSRMPQAKHTASRKRSAKLILPSIAGGVSVKGLSRHYVDI